MPLYEFVCESCEARFDEWTAVGTTAPCPECGSERTRRVFTPPPPPGRLMPSPRQKRESDARRAEREARRKERRGRR